MRLRRLAAFLSLAMTVQLSTIELADAGGPRRAATGQQRLREVSGLRSAVKRDPYGRTIVNRVLADRARTIDSVGDVAYKRIIERLGWVPLGADPELRKVTVATVLRKMRGQSREMLKAIDKEPTKAAWDVLFVGAGVHTALTANTLANIGTDDPIRMVAIEGSSSVGGNFREIGTTIARNSANRAARKGAKVRRGFGDKNPSEGPWGDPDLDGTEWPDVSVLADTATVNLFASGTDVILKTKVGAVQSRGEVAGSDGWPARYRVELKTGEQVRYAYANAIVDGTGLGKPKLTGFDDQTVRLVEAERAKIDPSNPDKVPDLLYYSDAMKLANLSKTGRDAYRGKPAPAARYERVTGTRLKTSLSTVLRLTTGDGEQRIALDEVVAIGRGGSGSTKLTLVDGRTVSGTGVVAEVGSRLDRATAAALLAGGDATTGAIAAMAAATPLREVPLQRGDTIDTLGERLGELSIAGERLRVRPLKFDKKVLVKPAEREVREVTPAERVATLRAAVSGDRNPGRAYVLVTRQDGSTAGYYFSDLVDAFERDGVPVLRDQAGRQTVGRRGSTFDVYSSGQQKVRSLPSSFAGKLGGDDGQPARPTIAVIGGRDSGRTFLEYLYGQAPTAAYSGNGKIDTAQRGDVGDVEWYVGERGPADCASFLDATRSRYLRLAGKVREADGAAPRAALNQSRVTGIRKTSNGRYELTDSQGGSKIVDKVIFAAGFEMPGAIPGEVEEVTGRVEGLDGERVIAKKVVGKDIYRIGPAAGPDVVGADERFSTDENAGSLYAFAPRDRALAKDVLSATVRTSVGVTPARPPRTFMGGGAGSQFTRTKLRLPRTRAELETPLSNLVLRAELNDALGEVRLDKEVRELRVTVSRRDLPDGAAELTITTSTGYAKVLASKLSASELLMDQLGAATASGLDLDFTVAVKNGQPKRTTLKIAQ
jgi:hypothetical protein